MDDKITLTLNSPITEEQWDDITDVDFEHTDRIWFTTKHGNRFEFVKASAHPEQKVGKWIVMDDDRISGRCSVCGWEAHMYEDDVVGMDYCPNCGAKMEE